MVSQRQFHVGPPHRSVPEGVSDDSRSTITFAVGKEFTRDAVLELTGRLESSSDAGRQHVERVVAEHRAAATAGATAQHKQLDQQVQMWRRRVADLDQLLRDADKRLGDVIGRGGDPADVEAEIRRLRDERDQYQQRLKHAEPAAVEAERAVLRERDAAGRAAREKLYAAAVREWDQLASEVYDALIEKLERLTMLRSILRETSAG
jgi:hypothetical protein